MMVLMERKAILAPPARKVPLDSQVLLARKVPLVRKAIPESRGFKVSRGQRVRMAWRLG